jgi:predicted transport protein
MEGIVSFGSKRSYDDFKKQIPNTVKPLFDGVREFCLSLGENVVEDIRMHRIVFGKSMTFRWFADVEPEKEGIIIKIQKSRKEVPQVLQIRIGQETTELKEIIKNAFKTIN